MTAPGTQKTSNNHRVSHVFTRVAPVSPFHSIQLVPGPPAARLRGQQALCPGHELGRCGQRSLVLLLDLLDEVTIDPMYLMADTMQTPAQHWRD